VQMQLELKGESHLPKRAGLDQTLAARLVVSDAA